MPTPTRNIFIDQGSYFSMSLTATGITGDPIALTGGFTASGQLRRSYYSATAVDFAVTVTGGTGGIEVSLGATTTAALKPGRYVYDVQLLYPNQQSYRIVQGTASVDPEVSK